MFFYHEIQHKMESPFGMSSQKFYVLFHDLFFVDELFQHLFQIIIPVLPAVIQKKRNKNFSNNRMVI